MLASPRVQMVSGMALPTTELWFLDVTSALLGTAARWPAPGTVCPSWQLGARFEGKLTTVALYSAACQVLPCMCPVRSLPSLLP